MIERFAAVIPAHNEENEIAGCLDSVIAALDEARGRFGSVEFSIIAIADACSDDTWSIMARYSAAHPLITPMTVRFNKAGDARNAAALTLTKRSDAGQCPSPAQTWLAFTDADSRVPRHWAVSHLAIAEGGAHCIVGTVEPRPCTASPALLAAWHAAHDLRDGHPYVFGANLGVRGDWFERVGGFPAVHSGEDAELVAAVAQAGGILSRTDACRVATSGRLVGRAPDGFAQYLSALESRASAPEALSNGKRGARA